MRSITGATSTGSGATISSPAHLRLEQRAQVAPVLARELRRARSRRRGSSIICRARSSSGFFTSSPRRPPRSRPASRRPRRGTASRARARRPSHGRGRGSRARRERTDRAQPSRSAASPRAGARTAGAAPAPRGTRKYVRSKKIGSTCVALTKRVISIERESSARSIASRSASSTMTNWPFVDLEARARSRPGVTSRSCVGHQRFCLIGVEHSRCRSRNETSDCRAAGFVAGASPTGIETRPKLRDPFQVVRMGRVSIGVNSSWRPGLRFRPAIGEPLLSCSKLRA